MCVCLLYVVLSCVDAGVLGPLVMRAHFLGWIKVYGCFMLVYGCICSLQVCLLWFHAVVLAVVMSVAADVPVLVTCV